MKELGQDVKDIMNLMCNSNKRLRERCQHKRLETGRAGPTRYTHTGLLRQPRRSRFSIPGVFQGCLEHIWLTPGSTTVATLLPGGIGLLGPVLAVGGLGVLLAIIGGALGLFLARLSLSPLIRATPVLMLAALVSHLLLSLFRAVRGRLLAGRRMPVRALLGDDRTLWGFAGRRMPVRTLLGDYRTLWGFASRRVSIRALLGDRRLVGLARPALMALGIMGLALHMRDCMYRVMHNSCTRSNITDRRTN